MPDGQRQCPVCEGTGQVLVPLGWTPTARQEAVLVARYDPDTGAIVRAWREVARATGESAGNVQVLAVRAAYQLRQLDRAATAGLPLTPEALAALARWRPVLTAETDRGRYRAVREAAPDA